MEIITKINDLREFTGQVVKTGASVGFVPTMGALHEGHLSLVKRSKNETGFTIVSVFVNPDQFNDPADYMKYPRDIERDAALLRNAGADVLFHPEVNEIYPPGEEIKSGWDFGYLDKPMEGRFRPGHFAGVARVMNRLLGIVEPGDLYMGQKDYQQVLVVKELIRQEKLPCRLVMCPTVREPGGLAMSSRNIRLAPEQRPAALSLYPALTRAGEMYKAKTRIGDIERITEERFNRSSHGARLEYFELADPATLRPAADNADSVIACIAAFAGDVRLIDNLIIS